MRQPLKALEPRNAWINPAIVFFTLCFNIIFTTSFKKN